MRIRHADTPEFTPVQGPMIRVAQTTLQFELVPTRRQKGSHWIARGTRMHAGKFAAVLAICVAGADSLAQPPRPPQPLPRLHWTRPPSPRPTLPVEAAKQREAAIKAPQGGPDDRSIRTRSPPGRSKAAGGPSDKGLLKDFGADRMAATEAALIIQNLRLNQLGTVPGSSPPFEYWLTDGKTAQAERTGSCSSSRSPRGRFGPNWLAAPGSSPTEPRDSTTLGPMPRRPSGRWWSSGSTASTSSA